MCYTGRLRVVDGRIEGNTHKKHTHAHTKHSTTPAHLTHLFMYRSAKASPPKQEHTDSSLLPLSLAGHGR